MKINGKSRLTAARAAGGIVGVALAGASIVAGIGVMVAAPFVGGIAVGMAVAGAVHGTLGVITGLVAGFAAAGVSGSIGVYAGLGVMAAGVAIGTAVGSLVNGTLNLVGRGVKGAFRLAGFGKKPAPAVTVAPTPVQATVSTFKPVTSKDSFEEAAQPAPQNDNAVKEAAPRQQPNTPKF